MTATNTRAPAPDRAPGTRPGSTRGHTTLTDATRWAVLAASLVLGILITTLAWGWNAIAAGAVSAVLYLVGIYTISRFVEGHRHAVDRVVTGVVTTMFLIALLPLVSVVWEVTSMGLERFDAQFFTWSMRGVMGEGGGAYHAIMGTLIITGLTTLISVPIGIFAAIYLVEYSNRNALSKALTFFVDVMTGIPSIVAGLFAIALFTLFFGPGVRMGIIGAVALTVLMIPVVVRSTEEMLRLVPNELREASYALGVPKWLTVVKVVLPTAIAGIATGVTLAIARVIGETAPLLVTVGTTDSMNLNPFDGRMQTLPIFAYYSYATPGIPKEPYFARMWAAALTLILIVMALNIIARLISKFFAPKTGR
ncbi:phosphate ABC transporter permease PstA [Janibacter cremeus]|uniref:Phosphate transport system permease protein PstA n=1 Tax=Janibacter cremeus TaxID=1285192 RepID=A0A852VLQ9_9MICO|nr:phosphate ABC transporter permease PstA [Janibacter cremeus]NYF97962.1 phosphate transport system permease protein [Janibacter cremeus]